MKTKVIIIYWQNIFLGEDDLSISGTTNDSIRMKKGRMEVIDLER